MLCICINLLPTLKPSVGMYEKLFPGISLLREESKKLLSLDETMTAFVLSLHMHELPWQL